MNSLGPPAEAAKEVFRASLPLEDLADPAAQNPIHDLNLHRVTGELRSFLLESQDGARSVAKLIFERISIMRGGEFRPVLADKPVSHSGRVFQELPADRTHDGVRYFEHVLQGLRTKVPGFVDDLMAGGDPPTSVRERVGGVVLVHF